jgi:hypothetical protein
MNRSAVLTALCALVLLPGLVSCERFLLGRDAADDPEAVFEYLWHDVHERYSYFEVKGIDWHEVGDRYRRQIRSGMGEFELFDVLADLLFELEDGHVNLSSPFDRSRNWDFFQDYPLDYDQGLIDRNYLKRDFWITGPLRSQILDTVLYVNYRSFMEGISQTHLDYLMARAEGLTGVIIDVRSNGGGDLGNAQRLAARFVEEGYVYGQVRIKNGACEDCFSSWTDLTVPSVSGPKFLGKVVVLTDRASYSSTTYFAQMMRQNPSAVLVGSPTGGGGGTPVYGELPNGWIYRFSSTQAVNVEGEHLEIGIPVDYEVQLDPQDVVDGVDSIIEFALGLF